MRGDGPQARQVNAGSVVYAIGEDRTSPWLEAIGGIRGDHVPGWAPSPCRLPGPVTRYGAVVTATQARPSERQPVSVCGAGCAWAEPGRSARGAVGVWASGREHTRALGLQGGAQLGRNYGLWAASSSCSARDGLPLYLDAQRLSLEFVGAADAWAAGRGSSLQELVRSYIYHRTPCT